MGPSIPFLYEDWESYLPILSYLLCSILFFAVCCYLLLFVAISVVDGLFGCVEVFYRKKYLFYSCGVLGGFVYTWGSCEVGWKR